MGEDSFVVADKARSYRSIEDGTDRVRKMLGLRTAEPLPGERLFEDLDTLAEKLGLPLPVTYTVNDLNSGQLATTRYQPKFNRLLVTLSPATHEGLRWESERARFSLAHEVGHVVLHPTELVRMGYFPERVATQASLSREGISVTQCRSVEWQANAFAAALLVPAAGITDLVDEVRGSWLHTEDGVARRISDRYGVSGKTAKIRLDVWQRKLGGSL